MSNLRRRKSRPVNQSHCRIITATLTYAVPCLCESVVWMCLYLLLQWQFNSLCILFTWGIHICLQKMEKKILTFYQRNTVTLMCFIKTFFISYEISNVKLNSLGSVLLLFCVMYNQWCKVTKYIYLSTVLKYDFEVLVLYLSVSISY